MARKTMIVTIVGDDRDAGKTFVIKEMPATQAEKWAFRAITALSKAGVEIPDNVAQLGTPALALMSVKAICGMNFEDAEPLMDEMFACVTLQFDPAHPEATRALIESDIEEVVTRVKLRKAWLTLHTGFSFPAEA